MANIKLRRKKRLRYFLFSLIGILIIAFIVVRIILYGQFEKSGLQCKIEGADTRVSDSFVHKDLSLVVKDRVLRARWFPASLKSPAVFILHGNGENCGDWIRVQQYLQSVGYSSFVFDYSGFGMSTGHATIRSIDEDALAAYTTFMELSKSAEKKILFGHSLGSCVFLDNPEKFEPVPDRIVLHGTISSARDYLVETGMLSSNIKWLVPDIWDNIENLESFKKKVYVVQGGQDQIVQETMRTKIAGVLNKESKLLQLQNIGHNDIFENPCDSIWMPILTFIK